MTHEEWMKRQKLKWNPYYLPLDSRMWDVIRIASLMFMVTPYVHVQSIFK